MGLFTKKKETQKAYEKPIITEELEFPNLPEFPTEPEEETQEFPSYEPTISEIKKGVDKEEEIEIPVREKNFGNKKLLGSKVKVEETVSSRMQAEEKPLFIKVDKYRDMVHTMGAIKAKLGDIDELLSSFEQVKAQEDEKIEAWKTDLQNLKEKLLSIDRDLSEV